MRSLLRSRFYPRFPSSSGWTPLQATELRGLRLLMHPRHLGLDQLGHHIEARLLEGRRHHICSHPELKAGSKQTAPSAGDAAIGVDALRLTPACCDSSCLASSEPALSVCHVHAQSTPLAQLRTRSAPPAERCRAAAMPRAAPDRPTAPRAHTPSWGSLARAMALSPFAHAWLDTRIALSFA